MADTKISELPVATSIASPDVAPVVRGGVTMQADVSLFRGGSSYLRIVDLGMISLRDAAIYGRTRPIIPFGERLIKAIHFVPTVIDPATIGAMTWYFATPNTYDGIVGIGGYGSISQFNTMTDTAGLFESTFDANVGNGAGNTSVLGDTGNPSSMSQICDCGPLIFAPGQLDTGLLPIGTWQPNHAYAKQDYIVDGNGNFQLVGTNGVSGGTEPTWATTGDTTDGTVTWHIEDDGGGLPTAEVHVIAEVIEGVSPMPLYPASLEWVSPPVNTPAGDPIPDILVMVKDQNGDPYKFFPLSMRIDIVGVGTLSSDPQEELNKATGLVTFSGVSIADPGTYIVRARMVLSVVSDPILSDPFVIT